MHVQVCACLGVCSLVFVCPVCLCVLLLYSCEGQTLDVSLCLLHFFRYDLLVIIVHARVAGLRTSKDCPVPISYILLGTLGLYLHAITSRIHLASGILTQILMFV